MVAFGRITAPAELGQHRSLKGQERVGRRWEGNYGLGEVDRQVGSGRQDWDPAGMPNPNPILQAACNSLWLLSSVQLCAATRSSVEPSRSIGNAATLPGVR